MASSRNSPGPHDRAPGIPRQRCIATNATNGKRCRRFATKGRSKLCKTHLELVRLHPELQGNVASLPYAEKRAVSKANRLNGQGKRVPLPTSEPSEPSGPSTNGASHDTDGDDADPGWIPEPGAAGLAKAGISTRVRKQVNNASKLVLNVQASRALEKLGTPYDPTKSHDDPKQILLNAVASSWRQVQLWEAMLQAVPEADWQYLGQTPIPGHLPSSKGARIEAIQKFLESATKTAARTSKLAIDAGIEERLVRLAEEQQALIADTVRAGILAAIADLARRLHLGPDVEAQALDSAIGAAANQLRRLAAGGEEIVDSIAEAVGSATSPHSSHSMKDVTPAEPIYQPTPRPPAKRRTRVT